MGTTTGLMSFAEFERLPDDEQGYKLELLDGELIRMPPAFFSHMEVAMRIYDVLKSALQSLQSQGLAVDLGKVAIETGYHLGPSFLIPDVSVIHARQPIHKYPEGAPALAIEVVSESNSFQQMHLKVLRYFEYGAREVWVFDPRTSSVMVHYGEHSIEVREVLTTALFPGLAINLAEIFPA